MNEVFRPRLFAASLALCLGAALPATAQDDRGPYIRFGIGDMHAPSLDSVHSGVNHPTRCDALLYPPGVPVPQDAACSDNEPRTLSENSFIADGDVGDLRVGYAFGWLRIEAHATTWRGGSDAHNFNAAASNAALVGKDTEWAVAPTEEVSGLRSRELFLNAVVTLPNASRFTPYAGVGVGRNSIALRYHAFFVRKPDADYLAIPFDPDWPDAAKRAAAGTMSFVDHEIEDSPTGYQLLGGFEFDASENAALTAEVRWARFGDLSAEVPWSMIRSHAPVQADGATPFLTTLEFSSVDQVALTFGLLLRF